MCLCVYIPLITVLTERIRFIICALIPGSSPKPPTPWSTPQPTIEQTLSFRKTNTRKTFINYHAQLIFHLTAACMFVLVFFIPHLCATVCKVSALLIKFVQVNYLNQYSFEILKRCRNYLNGPVIQYSNFNLSCISPNIIKLVHSLFSY